MTEHVKYQQQQEALRPQHADLGRKIGVGVNARIQGEEDYVRGRMGEVLGAPVNVQSDEKMSWADRLPGVNYKNAAASAGSIEGQIISGSRKRIAEKLGMGDTVDGRSAETSATNVDAESVHQTEAESPMPGQPEQSERQRAPEEGIDAVVHDTHAPGHAPEGGGGTPGQAPTEKEPAKGFFPWVGRNILGIGGATVLGTAALTGGAEAGSLVSNIWGLSHLADLGARLSGSIYSSGIPTAVEATGAAMANNGIGAATSGWVWGLSHIGQWIGSTVSFLGPYVGSAAPALGPGLAAVAGLGILWGAGRAWEWFENTDWFKKTFHTNGTPARSTFKRMWVGLTSPLWAAQRFLELSWKGAQKNWKPLAGGLAIGGVLAAGGALPLAGAAILGLGAGAISALIPEKEEEGAAAPAHA